MMNYMYLFPRKRPLHSLVDELREGVKCCPECGDVVARLTTVHAGRIISRAELLSMREKVCEDDWIDLRNEWRHICRYCAQIATASREPLDIPGFYEWLKSSGLMVSSRREYIVRLRRLIDNYDHARIASAASGDDFVGEVMQMVPPSDSAAWRRSLAKYDEYRTTGKK